MELIRAYAFGVVQEEEVAELSKITGGCEKGDYWLLVGKDEANEHWDQLKELVFGNY